MLITVPRSRGPIELEGVSPDRGWVLYAIDPMGSASLAADGLTLRAVRVTGGRSYTVASGLLYGDYRAWCGGRLVMTVGGRPHLDAQQVADRDRTADVPSTRPRAGLARRGWLYALHVGRLLKLPPTAGYYGHTAWPYSVRR